MQTHFVFRHMETSNALRGYAEERLEKIKRYFADPLKINCTFSVEKLNQIVQFDVTLRNGLQLHASESTENMYSSVDMALAKMERQVRRYKERIRHHKANEGRSAKVKLGIIASESITDGIIEQQDTIEEQDRLSAMLLQEQEEQNHQPLTPKVIAVREVTAERLHVNQAIMQMNLMHKSFFVFTNAESDQINVVYALEDGNYGLIEPQIAAESVT